MFERLFALIKKEFLAIKNDKKSLMVVVLPPIVQVILFSFAATLEVKNINLALLNQDDSYKSKELIKDLGSSSYIKSLNIVKSYEDVSRIWLFSGVQRKEAHKLYNKLGYDENVDKAFVKYIN